MLHIYPMEGVFYLAQENKSLIFEATQDEVYKFT